MKVTQRFEGVKGDTGRLDIQINSQLLSGSIMNKHNMETSAAQNVTTALLHLCGVLSGE